MLNSSPLMHAFGNLQGQNVQHLLPHMHGRQMAAAPASVFNTPLRLQAESAEVEQTIRSVHPEGLLVRHQGLEGVLVSPGLDHDGDPVLFVHLKFRLVEPGIDPNLLSQSTISVRRALWNMGERRYPHLRYDFHDDQRILGTENW